MELGFTFLPSPQKPWDFGEKFNLKKTHPKLAVRALRKQMRKFSEAIYMFLLKYVMMFWKKPFPTIP